MSNALLHSSLSVGAIKIYWADDAAQIATSGLLAELGTTPHETEFSLKVLAAWRLAPQ
jgi:hypothetical protein